MNRSWRNDRRQERDQHRRDLDQHHGGAGVDVLLAGVEGDVVDAEPQHADHHDRDPLAAGRAGQPAAERDHAEAERADERAGPATATPGEKSSARWRIATNAEAHSTSVTPTAASGSQAGGSALGGLGVGRSARRASSRSRTQPRNRHRHLTRGYRTSHHDIRPAPSAEAGWAGDRRRCPRCWPSCTPPRLAAVRDRPEADFGPAHPHRVDGARAAVPPVLDAQRTLVALASPAGADEAARRRRGELLAPVHAATADVERPARGVRPGGGVGVLLGRRCCVDHFVDHQRGGRPRGGRRPTPRGWCGPRAT